MWEKLLSGLGAISDFLFSRESRLLRLKRKERVIVKKMLRAYAKRDDIAFNRLYDLLERVREDIRSLSGR